MKKFPRAIYFLIMAVMLLSLSGCGGSNNTGSPAPTTAGRKVMSVSSPAFSRNGSYKLYKGGAFRFASGDPKYYVAPVASGTETVSLNLEFADTFSDDSFVIVQSDDDTVVFGYNPEGTDSPDLETEAGTVIRWGGTAQKYTNLNVTGAAIDIDSSDEIVITLNAAAGTATLSGYVTGNLSPQNWVWHVSPDYPSEYWTLGDDTTKYKESKMLEQITSNDGIYIARDIRYTPDTLNFVTSQTARKDEDTEYVVYYDSTASDVAAEIAEISADSDYGSAYTGPYILASLPTQVAGMGGGTPGGDIPGGGNVPSGDIPGGGNPPSGDIPGGGGNPPSMRSASDSSITAASTMTHSASEAYNNPVLHITRPGTYRLKGTWHGQIWIDDLTADDPETNAESQVAIILDGVEVSCDVAPAIVFHDLYECGPGEDDTIISLDVGTNLHNESGTNAGAIVVIANGSTNKFTGANVYRIMKLKPKYTNSATDSDAVKYVNGTNISSQKKMYKMDGAFYSFVSMVIGAESSAQTGTLSITSTTFEGLDAEMHMLIDSGRITVTAPDDGINVNEDDVSVFTMDGGTLTISSTGGDGIDSNGWIVIKGGTLNITAGSQQENSNGEAGFDAEKGTYISSNATVNWSAASGNSTNPGDNPGGGSTTSDDQTGGGGSTDNGSSELMQPVTLVNSDGDTVLTITFGAPVSSDETDNRPSDFPTTSTVYTLYNRVNNFGGVKDYNK